MSMNHNASFIAFFLNKFTRNLWRIFRDNFIEEQMIQLDSYWQNLYTKDEIILKIFLFRLFRWM